MNQQHIVIIGGGYAGLMAATRLRRQNRQVKITLIDPQAAFVERIRLHEILAGKQPTKSVPYRESLRRQKVEFLQGRVTALDPARQQLQVETSNGSLSIGYDKAILALGSATTGQVPGVAEHALRLNNVGAVQASTERLRALNEQHGKVLVVGGGLTGIEAAAEVAERFPELEVTFAVRDMLGAGYAEAAAVHFRQRFGQLGVVVREHATVAGLEAGRAHLADGSTLPFDLCIWCGGFEAPALAREAGLPVDGQGRVVVEPTLQVVGQPALFAVGDAAVVKVDGAGIRMGCVSAMPMGAQGGTNVGRILNGQQPEPFNLAFAIRCISLGRHDALVQFTTDDDRPRERVWSGRRAIFIKEVICRMTLFAVYTELRFGRPMYGWLKRKPTAARSEATTAS